MWGTNTKKCVVWKGFYTLSLLYSVWFWGNISTFNEHPIDELTYLSRHAPISVAIHGTLIKEPLKYVDQRSKYLVDTSGWGKNQWKQCVNQVPVIGFNSGKYDINMVKEYFVKEISYNKEDECNEDVFAAKKENDYMFLITPKFKF